LLPIGKAVETGAADHIREATTEYARHAGLPAPDSPILDAIIARIVEAAEPDRIILFGSAARGELGPDSDIDLLVIKSGVEHRGRLEEDIHMNLFGVGVPVDVVVVTPEDVERLKDGVGSVIGPALAEGVEVYVAPAH
jgi:uncharacterized protein